MTSRMEELLSQIMQTEFHKVSGKEWDTVFESLLELLGANDPEIVDAALERTATAIWAEKYIPNQDPATGRDMSRIRLAAVLARLEQRADVVDRVLGFASRAGSMADDDEFQTDFLKWVDSFQPPPDAAGEWDNATLTIRMKLGAFGDDWETASPHLTDLLDHSALQVRAGAAAALGELITDETIEHARLGELMRDIHDREIERPGLAGPFYGAICHQLDELPGSGRALVKAWMLSILENRKAPEPPLPGFHFIGIDFHAHELFAEDPAGVRELIRIGRIDIAVAAAGDRNEIISGMRDVLIELGNSDDAEVCRLASWHLAYNYRTLHPRGQERGFVSTIPLSGGEALFLNGHPESPRHPYAAILYPPAGRPFTSDETRQWIDRLLPSDIRGPAGSFYPEGWPGQTLDGGQVSGDRVHFRWACGAVGSLKGDVPARLWDSFTIIWHGEKETWAPGDYVTGS